MFEQVPLKPLSRFGFESTSQLRIHDLSTDKRVKGEGNTEGPAGVHKVELIMHCTMVDRGNLSKLYNNIYLGCAHDSKLCVTIIDHLYKR